MLVVRLHVRKSEYLSDKWMDVHCLKIYHVPFLLYEYAYI